MPFDLSIGVSPSIVRFRYGCRSNRAYRRTIPSAFDRHLSSSAYVEYPDLSLEELGNVEPGLIGGIEGGVESAPDGVGTTSEFADGLVDTEFLPDIR